MSLNLNNAVREAFLAMRGNAVSTALSSLVLGFALAILALFAIMLVNLNAKLSAWGERPVITAYLKDSALRDVSAVKAELLKMPWVSGVQYVSKEDALKGLLEALKGHESILEGIGANPLPASIEIRAAEGYRDAESLKAMADALKKRPWADDVEWRSAWVERVERFVRFVEASAIVVGAFLLTATVIIISNTLRLTMYSRKREIDEFRSEGSSELQMELPFFIEAAFQGIASGIMAFGLLSSVRLMLEARTPPSFDFLFSLPLPPLLLALCLAASGVFFGLLGCVISMAGFRKI
jgi:cell division transport system permease protein